MEKLVICDNIILDENRDLWIECSIQNREFLMKY